MSCRIGIIARQGFGGSVKFGFQRKVLAIDRGQINYSMNLLSQKARMCQVARECCAKSRVVQENLGGSHSEGQACPRLMKKEKSDKLHFVKNTKSKNTKSQKVKS